MCVSPHLWPTITYLLNRRPTILYPNCLPPVKRRNVWGGAWRGVGFRHVAGEGKVGRAHTHCVLCHRPHSLSSSLLGNVIDWRRLSKETWRLSSMQILDRTVKQKMFLGKLVKSNKVYSLFVLVVTSAPWLLTLGVAGKKITWVLSVQYLQLFCKPDIKNL